MYHNRKAIVLILTALFQQFTLGTNSHFAPKAQVNHKVTSPTKIIAPGNDILSHGNIDTPTKRDITEKHLSRGSKTSPTKVDDSEINRSQRKLPSPTKTENPDTDISYGSISLPNKLNETELYISQGRVTLPVERVDPENYQSRKIVTTKINTPEFYVAYGSVSLTTKIDNTDVNSTQGSITLTTKTDNLKKYQSHKIIISLETINNKQKDQFNKTFASLTKTENTANKLSYESLTSSTKTNTPQTDLRQESGLSNRRQNPRQLQQFRPRSDSEIFRLLNEYRGIIKKYSQRNLNAFSQKSNNGSQDQPVKQLYNRGPIRHTSHPHWQNKYTKIARQKNAKDFQDRYDETRDTDFEVHATTDDGWRPGMPPRSEDPNKQPAAKVTQNEAQGAASRFTTRTTTTRRRRRTTPNRVTFKEECDYIAYYCLKAYNTGKVCARTLYFIHQTFTNYCMVDYVNCMERYDTWQIAHMGECYTLKILTEYLHYPYNDDYFLDNYYIVEDM